MKLWEVKQNTTVTTFTCRTKAVYESRTNCYIDNRGLEDSKKGKKANFVSHVFLKKGFLEKEKISSDIVFKNTAKSLILGTIILLKYV